MSSDPSTPTDREGQTTRHAYRKKPVTIEARQLLNDNGGEIVRWINSSEPWGKAQMRGGPKGGSRGGSVLIDTLEGVMAASPGDWIIRGIRGEFYPCKPDVFEQTYEAVSDVV